MKGISIRIPRTLLTQARLKQVLRYDPKTGEFFRLGPTHILPRQRTDLIGKRAGSPDQGYNNIMVDGRIYRAHRLAWLYVYGAFPKGQLDHKNRKRGDDRIANLREATVPQNRVNTAVARPSRSGLRGAHWHKRKQKWTSYVSRDGKTVGLGYFPTAMAAHIAYCEAQKQHYGEFFHVGGAS